MDTTQEQPAVLRRRHLSKILIGIGVLALVVSALIFALFANGQPEAAPTDEPILIPPPPVVDPETISNLLPRDSIPAIDDPQYAPAAEADDFMDADEMVIGVVINGDARAYPIPILSSHEIVNDVIGGWPVAVTWCPLCYTALVFSRQVEGLPEPLTFGVSGKLLDNTLVMYDRQTESLWSQLYGAAIDGSLADSRLSFFPSTLTEWQAWREQHPDTLVLSKPLTCSQFNCGTYATNPRGSYDVDPYASYYNSADEGVLNRSLARDEGRVNGRPKERVLGLRVAGLDRAYPFQTLKTQPLVNDTLNGEPVLVWFDPDTQTGAAYLRRVDGATLTFRHSPDDPGILIDGQTGSEWLATTGEAVSGHYRGERLPPLVATTAFAFGWYSYFPNSETFDG